MAPGVGGNGGGNRQTGTVPKTKPHNEMTREFNGSSRRDFSHLHHLSNNLSSLDWQPVNDSLPHTRTRKESNTSASRYSELDNLSLGEDNAVPAEHVWLNREQRSQVYHSDDDEASQGSYLENRYKRSNLGLPDKTQVAKRLTQIRDYVSQTMSMMDGLRATGGQRNMAQHEKLASMLEGLRDSEMKLQNLYERLNHLPPAQPQSLPPNETEPDHYQNHQMLEPRRERASKSLSPISNGTDSARKNELKKQVQLSQIKLQELQEQQASLKALRQKAQEQLKEAMEAQVLLAQHAQQPNSDNMIQERLHNLQRFFDTRNQMVQAAGLDEGEADASEMQSKLDELQAKKQHMDQLLAQFSNLNAPNPSEFATAEECERDVDHKMSELNSMREQLAFIQGNLSFQERASKKESLPFVEKSNASTSRGHESKSQQLSEARSKLQILCGLLNTVEELRESGQPVPDSLLQLMANHSDLSSSPTQPDRSDLWSQELNMSQPASEQLMNAAGSERSELFTEQTVRAHNSCERERAKHHQAAKHNNQEGKLGAKTQLEELMRNQELNLPQPIHNSSFHENGPVCAWEGSNHGILDENYNPEYNSEMHESNSVKNVSSNQPHNVWRKPSSGSGTSRYSWTSPYVPQEVRRTQSDNTPDSGPSAQFPPTLAPTQDIPPQPDSHWVVHQISQLQSQLQQMTTFYKNFMEKQHNCAPQWLPSNNMTSALGPYCNYIVSASQWQQQQLLVHSLNQCCQLIWHQQQELATLKEALRQLQHQPDQQEVHFSPQDVDQEDLPTPPSNLSRPAHSHSHPHSHSTLKASLSAGPSLAPPAVVSSAHSLPNLASPVAINPPHITPPNNRNVLSPPSTTMISLPPTLNNATTSQHNPNVFFNPNSHQFTDPNFINLYPPYGNNLNFEFPSPVNFFPSPPEPFLTWAASQQPRPPTTLNNQVPPGNRANNYWDNFRSYSRQNLLSNRAKSNDGLPQPQRTLLERFLNTDPATLPRDQLHRCRKERLNAQSSQVGDVGEREMGGEGPPEGEVASGYQAQGAARQQVYGAYSQGLSYQHNLCNQACSISDGKTQARQVYSPQSLFHVSNTIDSRSSSLVHENEQVPLPSTRLVNDCEAPRGSNKKTLSQSHDSAPTCERKVVVNKRNYIQADNVSQLNNCTETTESHAETENSGNLRPINLVNSGCIPRKCRNPRNLNTMVDSSSSNVQHNCIGEGFCLMATDKAACRKDNKGNVAKDSKTDTNKDTESLEECVYSEVAALISSNQWRPQFLLQLFKDLRLLSSCVDPNMQAALSSIHSLAARTIQEEQRRVNEESMNSQSTLADQQQESSTQPRNWNHKEVPQLPPNCAKLDWEVRSILVALLPFIKSQLSQTCTPALLETLRKVILRRVATQSTQDQLDAQLEDALHKFLGYRLGDVYEEILTVVADVLISELTFLRLINTVNHSKNQQNEHVVTVTVEVEEEEGEEEEVEGAVGGMVEEAPQLPSPFLPLHAANQARRTKSETVSETDLVEADQPRPNTGAEEERAETAEGPHSLEGEARGRDPSVCENETEESKTEANWAVEQDREMGLDQVPIRLHNPPSEEAETDNNPDPGVL